MDATPLTDDTGDDLNVFLFWPFDNRLLSRANYESLESILESYPRALVRPLAFANDHAMRAHFGFFPNQFAKYQKMGYDVSMGLDASDVFASVGIRLAHDYFTRWTERCCPHCYSPCHKLGQPLPYHLQLFAGLTKLYKKGGVLTDLSYRFLPRFNDPFLAPGFHIYSYCADRPQWLWEQQAPGASMEASARRCYTSTLLVFNSPRHPAVTCALAKYGSDPALAQCIESDAEQGGAQCMSEALRQCFSQLRLANSLSQSIVSSISTGKMKHLDSAQTVTKVYTPFVLETYRYNYSLAADKLEQQWTPSVVGDTSAHRNGKLVLWMGSLATSGDWRRSLRNSSGVNIISSGGNRNIATRLGGSDEGKLVSAATSALILIDGIEKQLTAGSNASSIDGSASNSSLPTDGLGSDNACLQSRCRPFSATLEYLKRLGTSTSYGADIESHTCTPAAVVVGFSQSGVDELARILSRHPQIVPPVYSLEADSVPTLHAPYRSRPSRALLHRMWAFPSLGSNDLWSVDVPDGERAPFMTFDASGTYALDYLTPYLLHQDNPDTRALFVVSHPVHRMYREYISIYQRVHGELERLGAVNSSSSSSSSSVSSPPPATSGSGSSKAAQELQNLQNMLRLLSTGFDSLAEYGMSFPTKYSALRRLLTNETQAQSQGEPSGGTGNNAGASSSSSSAGSDLDRQLVSLYYKDVFINGVITPLFAHSVALPAIAHFQQVLGRDNVRVFVSEDRRAYLTLASAGGVNKTLLVGHKAMVGELERFLGLCPHQRFKAARRHVKLSVIDDDYDGTRDDAVSLDSRRRAKHADAFDDATLPPELRMSRQMYQRLVRYFAPFVNKLGVHLSIDLSHWATQSPLVLQQLTETAVVNASATDGQDASWFDLGDSSGQVGKTARVEKTASLIAKLLPRNDPRYVFIIIVHVIIIIYKTFPYHTRFFLLLM